MNEPSHSHSEAWRTRLKRLRTGMKRSAPFVAGIGFMTYGRFMFYNVVAGIAWVGIFIFGGYYFGNLPSVKNNFTIVIAAIIIISTLPPIIEFLRHRFSASRRNS